MEKGEGKNQFPAVRAMLTERLTAAEEEILARLEETFAEYKDREERSQREISRQRRLLDDVMKDIDQLQRAGQSLEERLTG